MTLTQMRYLIAIVDCGFNISRAAAALHTSQPGISRQVRLLEEQLGAKVLARNGGRIVGLTECGVLVVRTARRVVKEANSLALMSQDFMKQAEGKLSVGTLHTYALSLLPRTVATFRQRYPDVVIEVRQTPPALMVDLLRSGDIDLAITIRAPDISSGLLGLQLMMIPPTLIVPAGHPLLKVKGPLKLKDLVHYPMICHESLSSSTWGMLQEFAQKGIELKPAVYALDGSVIQAYVAAGAGIAVISDILPRATGVRVIDVSHLFEHSAITAVIDPHRYLRGYVYEFITCLAPNWTKVRVEKAIRGVLFKDASASKRAPPR